MKNMFNKANTPYLVSSTLAIQLCLASGVFAVAPYVGFLAPIAVLGIGLPFIIGGAVFSALVATLSIVAISKNNTISQQEKFENRVAQRKQEEKNARAELKIPDTIELPYKLSLVPDVIALPDKDGRLTKNKDLSHEEVKGKANQDVKQFRDTMIYASTIALTLAPVIASAFIAPVSMSVPTAELSGQQTPLSQADGNSTVNLSSAHCVPTPQIVLENKASEYKQTLDNAFKRAKNNFGIPQNSSEPQWFRDLHKSETTEEIIDGGALSNLFYEGSNSDYQFAKPNITHAESSKTIGSNQTDIAKYSGANTGFTNFMDTYGSFLKNLNPFGSREHPVSMVQDQVESDKIAKHQGTLIDIKLSKLTTERPICLV